MIKLKKITALDLMKLHGDLLRLVDEKYPNVDRKKLILMDYSYLSTHLLKEYYDFSEVGKTFEECEDDEELVMEMLLLASPVMGRLGNLLEKKPVSAMP